MQQFRRWITKFRQKKIPNLFQWVKLEETLFGEKNLPKFTFHFFDSPAHTAVSLTKLSLDSVKSSFVFLLFVVAGKTHLRVVYSVRRAQQKRFQHHAVIVVHSPVNMQQRERNKKHHMGRPSALLSIRYGVEQTRLRDQSFKEETLNQCSGDIKFTIIFLTIQIIRVTLNTESATLQFYKVGSPMEQLTKMQDTSPERSVLGTVPGVGFMLIDAVLCLQSRFEDCTFCIAMLH